MILLIDNYDSFSYNLYQLIGSLTPDIKVIRNDEMTVEQIEKLNPKAIIISPGPGRPENAGVCVETVQKLGNKIPIFGVCLGHQSICMAYGAKITYAKQLMHGKQSVIKFDKNSPIFKNIEENEKVARYHSLAVDESTVPECLQIIARADDGEVMAVKHKEYNVYGLQFHPESIMTPSGKTMLKNFINIGGTQK
ncbi:MAG: aminodeoxychorismate/anthranilate synthase component II [Clostridia bacterium]|nr:aminodeoxychorismate/anthranilate synthase component II [Clostridia bacterium]